MLLVFNKRSVLFLKRITPLAFCIFCNVVLEAQHFVKLGNLLQDAYVVCNGVVDARQASIEPSHIEEHHRLVLGTSPGILEVKSDPRIGLAYGWLKFLGTKSEMSTPTGSRIVINTSTMHEEKRGNTGENGVSSASSDIVVQFTLPLSSRKYLVAISTVFDIDENVKNYQSRVTSAVLQPSPGHRTSKLLDSLGAKGVTNVPPFELSSGTYILTLHVPQSVQATYDPDVRPTVQGGDVYKGNVNVEIAIDVTQRDSD